MDYKGKYLKYKTKYLELKNICENNIRTNKLNNLSDEIQEGGSITRGSITYNSKINNWCRLPKDAKLYFGSGGSDGIIAVVKDRAYKYFPVFIYPAASNDENKMKINDNKYEIEVIKELTKQFVKTKKTPHIITYYDEHKCNELPDNIFKNCPSYVEMLESKKKTDPKCNLLYNKGYPRELIKPMYVLEMEKADGSIGDLIEKISKKKWETIKDFLNKFYFQIFYTLETIKLLYPDYSHNDLFIRNIMYVNKNYNTDEYIRYHYLNMVFDVPANGPSIKINDFGMNQISKNFSKKNNYDLKLISNPYRDYFSILYDVYNGGNLGGKSMLSITKNKDKLKQIDKYFNLFFDVKTVKKIIANNKKRFLDWDWNKTYDDQVVELLGLKNFIQYLKHFVKIFPFDSEHKIVEEYGL